MQTTLRRASVLMCALGIIVMYGCKHIPRGDIRLPTRHYDFAQKVIELAPYIELDNGTAISMPQTYSERFTLVHEYLMAHMQSSPPPWIVAILKHDATVLGHIKTETELKDSTKNMKESMNLEGDQVRKDASAATPHTEYNPEHTAPDHTGPDYTGYAPNTTGYAPSQDLLARMYLEGDGVEQDSARAFNLALNAARQGHTKAQVLVATLYNIGHGVTQNPEQAFLWTREAARDGEPEAMAMLADAYRLGSGTAPDDQEAFLWTLKASKAGVLRAHIWLGLYHHAMRRVGR